ncbi:MAG: TetR/AcrR family transcriptional regulator [Saprospiraceae bacterium]|nr:TetR/AcrR family transcriptional regulator [Saprospiraceae bacterium]
MSPRTKEQIAQIRRESRQQILDAALLLFAQNGFHNTSISTIAKEANISKGLVYNYFESKDDLLRQIVETAMQIGDDFAGHLELDDQDPVQSVHQTIDDLFSMLEQNPTYWKLIISLSLKEDIMLRFKDQLKQQAQKNLAYLTNYFRQLQIPEPTNHAMLYAAALDGIFLHYIYAQDLYPLSDMKDFLKRSIASLLRQKIDDR